MAFDRFFKTKLIFCRFLSIPTTYTTLEPNICVRYDIKLPKNYIFIENESIEYIFFHNNWLKNSISY